MGEADKIRGNFDKAKGRDAYLLRQMADKTARAEEEKEEEMYEAEQIKQWMGDDDAIFDQYAQMCLDEWVAQGKNPKRMERAGPELGSAGAVPPRSSAQWSRGASIRVG